MSPAGPGCAGNFFPAEKGNGVGERGSVLGRAAWKMVVGTAVAAGLLIAVAPIASILRPHGAQASRQAADDDPAKAGADTHEARVPA